MGKVSIWSKSKSDAVPDFLKNKERHSFEDVVPERRMEIYRIAQALSDVASEKLVEAGNIYEIGHKEPLGEQRHIIIFEKRLIRKKMNPEGVSVACQGTGVDARTRKGGQGRVRMYNKDDIATEDLEAWGIPLDAPAEDTLPIACDECPFSSWKKDANGKNIPPACNFVHEIFFLDVQDEFDSVPKKVELAETNANVRQSATQLDNLIERNLRSKGVSDFAGIFLLKSSQVENAKGKKYYILEFEFTGMIPDEKVYTAVEECHRTFKEQQEAYENSTEVKNVTTTNWTEDKVDEDEVPWN